MRHTQHAAMLRLVSARCRAALSARDPSASTGAAAAAAAVGAASSVAVAGAFYLATDDARKSVRQRPSARRFEDALRVSRGSAVAACEAAGEAGAAGASPFVAVDAVWWMAWRAPVHYVVGGVASTGTLCASYLLVATAACEAAAAGAAEAAAAASPFVYPELTAGIRARARQERKLREYFNTSAPLVHAARMEVDKCARSGDAAALNRAQARFATLAARLQAESAELTWGSRDGRAWQMLPATSPKRMSNPRFLS